MHAAALLARQRRRRRWLLALGIAAGAGLLWFLVQQWLEQRPIVVGILHSQTGPMAVSERAMVEAEVLALEQINAAGGLLGRPLRWVIADGASDWPTFARQAERLVRDEKVSVIFGCWTSASRKSVLPLVEEADHLLVYPMAYEGIEESPQVVYTGAAPNQQITPAVQWCYDTLNARRYFLVGSDYIWPHCVNEIITDQLAGIGAEKVGEVYIPFGSRDATAAVEAIIAAKPDVVLCSVVGDSAGAFFQTLRQAGVNADDIPVVSFSIAEGELRTLDVNDMAGH
jgi:urea transport system substrate-binding protein